jgi:F-type H+-transporting ATPase subunit delta
MRDTTIARNYADALYALAQKANDPAGWGRMIQDVAAAMQKDRTLHLFLESPRVSAAVKKEVLGKALQDRMPRLFVRFLQALVSNRRQMLVPVVATEYMNILDVAQGRMHANVTVAQEPDDATRKVIVDELSRAFQKEVVPHFQVNPSIIGGTVVRVGDTVIDGSVRRKLASLRRRMLARRA